MSRKLLLVVIVLIFLLTVGVFTVRTRLIGDLESTDNSTILTENLPLEDCKSKEIQNLKNNEYLLAEQLSVVFYTKPSSDLIDKIAGKYNLEIIQIYKDPNVIFKVKKENAPMVKCQLQNESEIKKVVFIESRPVPAK